MKEQNDYPAPSFRLVALIALCVGIGAGAWAFFSLIIPSISDDGKTVFIQADKSPIKVPPNQPGGMEIPHQDKLVFNAVTPGAKPVPDRLAPPPEQPLSEQAQAPQSAVAPPEVATTTLPVAAQPPAGLTDTPGARVAATAPATPAAAMPIALGRAIAGAPGASPTSIAGAQAVKATSEPATSFDYGTGGQPPAPAGAKPQLPAANVKEPVETKKLVAQNEALAKDPATNDAKPDAEGEQPILPSAHAMPNQDAEDKNTAASDDSDQDSDDTADDAAAEPAPVKKSKPVVSSRPEDEPVTYSPSPSARYQLASYTDRAAAQRAIGSFGSKYSDVLSKSSLTVVAGRAKGRQVYRVQGRASSKDEAAAICGRVKAKGGSCVIAH